MVRIILFVCLLAGVHPVFGVDELCSKRESGRTAAGWIHALPGPAGRVPAELLAQAGGVVLLDEQYRTGRERVFTLIAQLYSRESFADFGAVTVDTGLDEFAQIRARVLQADGTVIELRQEEFRCTVTVFDYRGVKPGKSQAPKRYLFHFPGLAPGAIIQYQIHLRSHLREPVDWGALYTRYYPIWLGVQWELRPGLKRGVDPRLHYPALLVRLLFNLPRGMRYETAFYPPDAVLRLESLPPIDEYGEKIVSLSGQRPHLPDEAAVEEITASSPGFLFYVKSTALNAASRYWLAPRDWQEWITRELSDALIALQPQAELMRTWMTAERLQPATGPQVAAERLCTYLRDEVANSNPGDMRTTTGLRPPRNVLFQGKTGTPLDKAAAMIALLRGRDMEARLVLARRTGLRAVDRRYPAWDWFRSSQYLVAVHFGAQRWYCDPVNPQPLGNLVADLRGSEALLMESRRQWEWIILPDDPPPDDTLSAEIRVSSLEGGGSSGTLKIELQGAAARRLRRGEIRPEQWIETLRAEGASFTGVEMRGGNSPDEHLVVSASFNLNGGATRVGRKLRLTPFPINPTFKPADFPGERRVQPLVLAPGERILMRVWPPPGAKFDSEAFRDDPDSGAAAQNPAPLTHKLRLAQEIEGAPVELLIETGGRWPAERFGEFKALLDRLEAARSGPLPLIED